ncbi:HTH domain-containing protein [Bifidobacterium eulemuris]|uniref:Uncharacterized protein n=1 Tax=Bifidobacterium eulemuris TaxID=1765219 RepID=A0A261GEN5_9BIFI|nr:HTH domain-containing protein [Bifidobacterium eulemuris]OZG69535.1 hypothetical protein BEUL_0127 [Bifidobacterium eulemuris]QOL32081.1 hypothetical protein BE0216_06100 [Bifidobacterium eulemuris]
MGRTAFTREERAYLLTLPAVADVSEYRIHYSPEFRKQFLRRYRAGESPVALFREAGLDPKIIGRKRIERCTNRWASMPLDAQGDDDTRDVDMSVPSGGSLEVLTRSLTLMQARRISELEERVARLEERIAREPVPLPGISVGVTRSDRVQRYQASRHSLGRG